MVREGTSFHRSGPPERIIPEFTTGGPLAAHLKRYEFASQFCRDKHVLDVACGVGYGTASLAQTAGGVIGMDISMEAVQYASIHYQRLNTAFLLGDAHRLPFRDQTFDLICSFETIEHLEGPSGFLAEIVRVLRDQGTFMLSTPHVRRTRYRPKDNPYHVVEFSRQDLEELLRGFFTRVEIYGQRRVQSTLHYWLQRLDVLNLRSNIPRRLRASMAQMAATKPWDNVSADDLVISGSQIERATEIIAVCQRSHVPQ